MTDYNFKITYQSETANVIADAFMRKHSELLMQKEKNVISCTQMFIDFSYIIAVLEDDLSLMSESAEATEEDHSDTVTVITESKLYKLMNHILKANQNHESLNKYWKITK